MIIRTLVVGFLETNCYLVSENESGDAVIIDPGADAAKIFKAVEQKNLNIKYIILTHGHHDHIGALNDVREKFEVPILAHKDELYFMHIHADEKSRFGESGNTPYLELLEGDTIDIGDLSLKVLATPGHTPGGTCFLAQKCCFTGDTLFCDGVGRTDFPGGCSNTLMHSIRDKLMTLEDDIKIFPGHGPSSTIGIERRYFR